MLNAYTYHFPFKQPFTIAGDRFTHRDGIILVYKDQSLEAYGDVAPLPGFSGESLAQVKDVLKINKEYLQDSFSNGTAKEAIRLLEQIHHFPSLSFGIDTLAHDLEAKRDGIPLVRYLFDQYTDPLLCNATLPMQEESLFLSNARDYMNKGYSTLKVKMGKDFDKEYALLKKVRDRFPELTLRVDVNGAWSVDEAIRHIRSLDPLRIEYCEQPVSAKNITGLKAVKDAVETPIAADESIRNKSDATELSVNKMADVLVLKPMLLGTFENIFVTNEIAVTHNLETVYTTSLESAIGRAATAAISAGLQKAQRAQGLGTGLLLQNDVSTDDWLNSAEIQFPDSPGLGISLHLEGLKKLF